MVLELGRALDAGHEAHGDPGCATGRGRGTEHRRPDRGLAVAVAQRCRTAGVDLDDREVAVPVDARDPPGRGPAIGEADRGLAAAEVVGVRDDAAVRDDDAGAALPLPDADHRGTDLLGDRRDGRLELFEDAHDARGLPCQW